MLDHLKHFEAIKENVANEVIVLVIVVGLQRRFLGDGWFAAALLLEFSNFLIEFFDGKVVALNDTLLFLLEQLLAVVHFFF